MRWKHIVQTTQIDLRMELSTSITTRVEYGKGILNAKPFHFKKCSKLHARTIFKTSSPT
jgi:hypothetical protein